MKWETLQNLKVASMKSGDKARVKVLNDIIVLVQKEQTKGKTKLEVTEEMINTCAMKAQKTLEEMVETCPKTDAYAELLADYQEQLAIVKEYAPQMIADEAAIRSMILDTINGEFDLAPANKGKAMKLVMPVLKSQNCDMKIAQSVLQGMFK